MTTADVDVEVVTEPLLVFVVTVTVTGVPAGTSTMTQLV